MTDVRNIGAWRKKLGLTQSALAQQSGVSQSLIAKIEAGRIDPTYSKTIKILQTLKSLQQENSSKARDIMESNLITITPNTTLKELINLMQHNNISQIPVFQKHLPIGLITESIILHTIMSKKNPGNILVKEVMTQTPPIVSIDTDQQVITQLLEHYQLVLVTDQACICGIITKADLLKTIL